jgi:hypothetical protein
MNEPDYSQPLYVSDQSDFAPSPFVVLYTEVPDDAYPYISATYTLRIYVDAHSTSVLHGLANALHCVMAAWRCPTQHVTFATLQSCAVATLHFSEEFDSHYVAFKHQAEQNSDWFNSPFGPISTVPEYDAAVRSEQIVARCYVATSFVCLSAVMTGANICQCSHRETQHYLIISSHWRSVSDILT